MIATVLQGRDVRSAAVVRGDVLVLRRSGIRAAEARHSGLCSVCEVPAPAESLDDSGRCVECQP